MSDRFVIHSPGRGPLASRRAIVPTGGTGIAIFQQLLPHCQSETVNAACPHEVMGGQRADRVLQINLALAAEQPAESR